MIPGRVRHGLACVALIGATAAAPAGAGDLTLVCYLRQSGAGSPTDFIRRVEIDLKAGTVAIADNTGGGFRPLGYDGTLVTADKAVVTFDYASPLSSGRTVIDRRDGTYRFTDQRFVTRGTCSTSPGGQRPF